MINKWLGPYEISEAQDKGNYQLQNSSTNNILAKMVKVTGSWRES